MGGGVYGYWVNCCVWIKNDVARVLDHAAIDWLKLRSRSGVALSMETGSLNR
jgi:hypothetical protein